MALSVLKKKKNPLASTGNISILIVSPDGDSELDAFSAKLSSFTTKNKEISCNVNQQRINCSNANKIDESKWNVKDCDIVILFHCDSIIEELIAMLRIRRNDHMFMITYSINANESAVFREKVFNRFCNMVTNDVASIHKVWSIIASAKLNYIKNRDNDSAIFYDCPHPKCKVGNLTENDLWNHFPLYHIGAKNVHVQCPICSQAFGCDGTPFQVHLRNEHGLCTSATHAHEPEYREGVSSYVFSLVVVRRKSDNKFLLVQEFASTGFWLPGGRVDPGETTESAAVRECEEEAGVNIKLKGILKIEYKAFRYENKRFQHTPDADYNRMRVIYYGEPDLEEKEQNESGALLAKSIPDYESMGACWVHPDEITKVKLRAYEPSRWIPYVANGGTIYPMELMECEQRNIVK